MRTPFAEKPYTPYERRLLTLKSFAIASRLLAWLDCPREDWLDNVGDLASL